MRGQRAVVTAALALLVALAGEGHAEKQWTEYRNQDLGFSAYNYNAVKVMAPPGLNATTFRSP